MPKNKIADYTFYKIINVNCEVDLCYVGSTVNMIERVRTHKYNCKSPNSQRHNLKVYQTIRQHGGWDEFKMIPIGYAEQLTLTEAHVIEEKYRVELNANLNKNKCFRTEHEEQEHRSAYRREYAQKNKDKISKQRKVYRQNNIEVLTEREKVYKQNNKDKISVRFKEYYQNNKDALCESARVYRQNNKDNVKAYNLAYNQKTKAHRIEKITCDCGCELVVDH